MHLNAGAHDPHLAKQEQKCDGQELQSFATWVPIGEGRKSVATTNLQLKLSLTSKSVGSRKDASSRKHNTKRSGASEQKKRRQGRWKVLGEGRLAI
jgi:hypothetical protein